MFRDINSYIFKKIFLLSKSKYCPTISFHGEGFDAKTAIIFKEAIYCEKFYFVSVVLLFLKNTYICIIDKLIIVCSTLTLTFIEYLMIELYENETRNIKVQEESEIVIIKEKCGFGQLGKSCLKLDRKGSRKLEREKRGMQ